MTRPHCDHECNGEVCYKYRANFYQDKNGPCICTKCMDDTRSRSHPVPAQHEDGCRCLGCLAEKGRDDGLYCKHVTTLKAEAARTAREDVLKKFMVFYEERKKMNPITNQMCIDLLLYKIESLRGERE